MSVSPHVEERRRGFAILCGSDENRRSPLTIHLLATHIDEPDPALRAQIVHALADYYEVRGGLYRYPPELRGAVTVALRRCERTQVLSLLELHHAARAGAVAVRAEALVLLFQRIPDASGHLLRVASDRSLLISLRQAAIEVIGLVGFVDARAALEGLLLRIEGRTAGQLTMLFAPSDRPEETALLPALHDTLQRLLEDV